MARPGNTQANGEIRGEDLEELLARIGGDAGYIRLYRLEAGEKIHLQRMGPQATIDDIQRTHGGGEYLIQVCEQGSGKVKGSTRVRVAGLPRDPDDAGRVVAHSTAAPEPPPKTVAESIEQLSRRLDELRKPPAVAEQANPLAMTASIITALAAAAAPIIEIMKERRPRGSGRAHREKSLMDAYHQGLRTGVTIGARHGGDGGGGGSGSILEKLLTTVAPALQGRTEGLPPAETPRALPPAPGGTPRPRAVDPLPAGSPEWASIAAPYVKQLAPLAARGADPSTYSQLILDQEDDRLLDMIVEQVGRGEEFWQEFQSAFPGVDRAWFEKLLSNVWYAETRPDHGDENPGDVSHGNNASSR